MRLIERMRHVLDGASYPRASASQAGYLLEETEAGMVRLRWGHGDGAALVEAKIPVMICGDLLSSEGFSVQPGGWIAGSGDELLVRG